MLAELRFWNLVTACVWHAASCVTLVSRLHWYDGSVPVTDFSASLQVVVVHTLLSTQRGYLSVRLSLGAANEAVASNSYC